MVDHYLGNHSQQYMEILSLRYSMGQTKQRAGPHPSGFSTNIDTAQIHAEIRTVFSEKLRLTTSSQHEECTQRFRRLHYDHGKKSSNCGNMACIHFHLVALEISRQVWSFQKI